MRANKTMLLLAIAALSILQSIAAGNQLKATAWSDTVPGPILIVNSFDALSVKARVNKRELFAILTDSLKSYLAGSIVLRTGREAVIITELLAKGPGLDSAIFSLMQEHHCSQAILIWTLDASFKQTGTHETVNSDGKTKAVVSYALCTNNEYTLYGLQKILKLSTIEDCNPFTEREMLGRFFIAAGPDIVGKKKFTYEAVKKNADSYIMKIADFIREPSNSQ